MSKQKSKKVLIVDDFPAMRHSIQVLMSAKGYDATEANNGLEALSVLEKESFDLIITDLVMPEMDGFDLCEKVKSNKNYKNIPVIILSTQKDVRFIMKALKLGADDYLVKPIESELLDKVIERVF